MPVGFEVTSPTPAPDFSTVRSRIWAGLNVAITSRAAVTNTVQVVVETLSQPDQPPNVLGEVGNAVNVTLVPCSYVSVQSVPQSMPKGLDVTVPFPLPDFVTVNSGLGSGMNVAVTLRGSDIVTWHVGDEPEHAPLQPSKSEPAAAAAVNVTGVFNVYV